MKRITWVVILALLLVAAPQAAVAQTACDGDMSWSRILDRIGDVADLLLGSVGLGSTTTIDGDGEPAPVPEDDTSTESAPETGAAEPNDGEAGPGWDPMG